MFFTSSHSVDFINLGLVWKVARVVIGLGCLNASGIHLRLLSHAARREAVVLLPA